MIPKSIIPKRGAVRAIAVLVAGSLSLTAQVKTYKPGFNLFSPQQDIEIGKQAAEEVRRTMPVVNNRELTSYVNRVGQRLAKSSRAGSFPYTFEVINDPSINAFALPGGPMFVHTGLIAAVDNESELAGVLAHEISHVALRHGTNQASKANFLQLGAALGGALLGEGGLWKDLARMGIGLGAQSVLLNYSRDAEKEADLNGAQMMNDVGYNPAYAASFFQKLAEETGGSRGGRLEEFFSSHPNPGNRVQYVSEQNKYLPKKNYSELDPGALPRMKQIVASLPAPPKPNPNAAAGSAGSAAPSAPLPRSEDLQASNRFRTHRARDFSVNYPENWQVAGDRNADTATIAPKAGLVASNDGASAVGMGIIAAYYIPANARQVSLRRDTAALIQQIQQSNQGMRAAGQQRNVRVAGQQGIVTPLESPSPFQGQKEVDMVLTVARPQGLFYMVFIAPESEWQRTQPAFDQVIRSLKFSN